MMGTLVGTIERKNGRQLPHSCFRSGFTSQEDDKDHDMGNQKSGHHDRRDEIGSSEGSVFDIAQALGDGVEEVKKPFHVE